jgi:hypothetical protein
VILARICPLKKFEDGIGLQRGLGISHKLDDKSPVIIKTLAVPHRRYSASIRLALPGSIGIDLRVSAISCLDASSRHTNGLLLLRGLRYTSKTSSIAATNAAFALGGIHQYLFK